MADTNDRTVYCVRATNPASNEQVAYDCEGMAVAHAKAAELRMSGHRDVVMSVSGPNDRPANKVQT